MRPVVGRPTDEARFRELGEQACSPSSAIPTNIMREGESPSEADVAQVLARTHHECAGRASSSPLSRPTSREFERWRWRRWRRAAKSSSPAARWSARSKSRARRGYLDGIADFCALERYPMLSRDRVVVLATGSQGESARRDGAASPKTSIPRDQLASGDRVIFSSRTIPGNERAVNRVINGLIAAGRRGHHRPHASCPLSPAIPAAARSSAFTAGCVRKSPFPRMASRCTFTSMRALPARSACERRAGAQRRHRPARAGCAGHDR